MPKTYESNQTDNSSFGDAISRRKFLQKSLMAGMALSGAATLAVTPQSAFSQSSENPKYGGVLKFAVPDSPLTFDPCFMSLYNERWIPYILYNTLTYLTPEMKVVPSLALSWEPKDGAKSWLFHLRKGVKFHNGRELTAKDIAAYFNRVMDPNTGSSAVTRLSPLKGAQVVDKYKVLINLKNRYVDFPITVSQPLSAIIAPESAGRATKMPIGTGPFKFKKFIPGQTVVFEKNPDYWIKGEPYLDGIEWVNIPDPATRVSALLSGRVDTFPDLSKDFVDLLKKKKNVVVEEIPSGAHQPIIMQLSKPPFNDPRVVSAIKYCLDREKFVKLVLNGHGTPANDVAVPPNDPFYHGIPIRKQNYPYAKKLLADAGYPNGLDLELFTSKVRTGMVPSAITLKDMCEPAGIRIKITTWPPETYWKEVWRNKPFFVSNWVGRATVHDYLYQFYHQSNFNPQKPGGKTDKFNTSHFKNPIVSDLLEKGMTEMDPQRRHEIYKMAQALIMDGSGWIIPYNSNYIRAARKEVRNYPIHPLKVCDLSKAWKFSS